MRCVSTHMRHHPSARQRGLTLIEMVVVLFILVIVASLVVPVVGWVRRSSNYGGQGSNQSALVSNLELFRTTYGNDGYPDFFDSLVLTGTSDPIHSIPDYTDSGHSALYTVDDLTPDETACLKFISTIRDHDSNKHAGLQGNPGNGAIHDRVFDGTSVAVVADSTSSAGANADLVVAEFYPSGVPDDVRLVAFGIGPSNTAVGTTMQAAPLDPRVDNSEVYGRYMAIFAVYDPRAGRRAELKAIVNAKGRTQNNALSEFYQSVNPE